MYILPRQSLVLLVCSLVVVCILLGVLALSSVRADVGVQPILPGGSNIKPEGETLIQMAAEKVVMTVRQGTDADNAAIKLKPGDLEGYGLFPILLQEPFYPIIYMAVVEVTADFTMKNPTGETENLTVWFPLASALENAAWEEHIDESAPRVENFQVAVDGKPLEYIVTELPNTQGEDKPPLPWASFPVAFPAGKEVNIQVGYVFLPQPAAVDLVGMTLSYIFKTGAGWAGPIGKAELVVNLPYPASVETIGAMPEGGQVEGQQVRWTWENLEPGPQDDFSTLLLRPERWEELKYWRAIVNKYPDFGQGWLYLATLYERFSQGVNEHGHILQYFGETYQQLGVQAAKEAARLDPEAIGPHYELALLYASALEQNPSPEELQSVLDELKIMKELNPEEAQALEPNVNDILYWVFYNDATATADAIILACWETYGVYCDEATATADAATSAAAIPTKEATLTPEPSATSQPLPTVTSPAAGTGDGHSRIFGVTIIVIILLIMGILVVTRLRGGTGKQ